MPPEILIASGSLFADRAALEISNRLRAALEVGDRATLALAGGATPRPVYRHLAAAGGGLDSGEWGRVDFFFGDERLVGSGDQGSNVAAAWRELLGPLRIEERRVHAPNTDLEPNQAARCYETAIRSVVPASADGVPRFDLVLLGVGADGHTASIFPGPGVSPDSTGDLVLAPLSPLPPFGRISFSLDLLLAARAVLFLVAGADKADIVRRVLVERDLTLPAAGVLAASGRVTWVLDDAAASRLDG